MRANGFDLSLACTGYTVLDAGPDGIPRLVARGVIRPPTSAVEPQDKADIITDQVVGICRRYGGHAFLEKPILNAWGMRAGERVNMTSAETAMSKGVLIGSVRHALRNAGVRYDEIGIQRWRMILGLEGTGKDAIVAAARVWFKLRGIVFPDKAKDDEIEAAGVSAAGLVALRDPCVLAPGWRPPKRKVLKVKTVRQQEGLFDGERSESED